MFYTLNDYVSVSDYAKDLVKTKGKNKGEKGVTRAYVYELIRKEKEQPGATGLDVIEIAGHCYIKNKC